jgi:hypothetical protein
LKRRSGAMRNLMDHEQCPISLLKSFNLMYGRIHEYLFFRRIRYRCMIWAFLEAHSLCHPAPTARLIGELMVTCIEILNCWDASPKDALSVLGFRPLESNDICLFLANLVFLQTICLPWVAKSASLTVHRELRFLLVVFGEGPCLSSLGISLAVCLQPSWGPTSLPRINRMVRMCPHD